MARIPEREIERLKNEISVERLIESAGIECCAPRCHRISSQTAGIGICSV